MTPASSDSSAKDFIKAVSGDLGSSELLNGPPSPAASSSSTLGYHHEEHIIEMADLSPRSYCKEDDWEHKDFEEKYPEHKHFNGEAHAHKQGAAHTTHMNPETAQARPSGSGARPQREAMQRSPTQEECLVSLIHHFDKHRRIFCRILLALLLAACLFLATVITGAVEWSKDN
ncbi:hypothetical protein BCV69DRAFT_167381 [Microstroma glucosiphilum]|uniref:Uncharacterized protein n=1 Tax=Pseudomicrostroma glucosiphilum TaxID=1684307 RepID=A0A316UAA4_9BASI|nr:hypothetical protein BCV69DRAFT_167381 [Pseudomicrostroma glucosiphilum]PWN21343.1 hypothetical protein BCV69DRAFT_167381 [Pseudomicrostroma glucosiphilum]